MLVHQLIRQYAMAWILILERSKNKKVVPFVVGGKKEQSQIRFMIKQGWLVEDNVLCWEQINEIAKGV